MQTSVQKEKAVRFGSWVAEVYNWTSWVNIWMISDAKLAVTKLIKQFIWANAKLSPKSRITEAKFNFNLYEIDLTTINLINWDWNYSYLPWVAVPVSWEALWTWWTIWNPIQLVNKDWDNTEVSSIVIKADGSALTLDTDYSVYVDLDWFTNITPLTTQSWVLTADYSYTPNASKTMEFWDADQTLNLQWFRFTNTDENWKIFRLEILKWYNSEWVTVGFKWDEDADPASMAASITAFPDSNTSSTSRNLFKIYDEQSIS